MKTDHKKMTVAILCGGRSAEHEVSITSARNIVRSINRNKYDLICIYIDHAGHWFQIEENELLHEQAAHEISHKNNRKHHATPITRNQQFFIRVGTTSHVVDAVFPVLHGTYGEDGAIQGMLRMFNVPFVGPCVLGSSVGMDKDASKRLLRDASLPVAKFLVYTKKQMPEITFAKLKKELGIPFFVKPAHLGSSVGISKVKVEKELSGALRKAYRFDHKILIEKAIVGKEIEVAVLGNDEPIASIAGEIIPTHDFYSYEAKYLDENGAHMAIPAQIPRSIMKKIQKMALRTFDVLCCQGMGRVDFFLTHTNEIYINEINTIPGFTSNSMYPKLWEQSGLTYTELIDRLITLAIERHKKEQRLCIRR